MYLYWNERVSALPVLRKADALIEEIRQKRAEGLEALASEKVDLADLQEGYRLEGHRQIHYWKRVKIEGIDYNVDYYLQEDGTLKFAGAEPVGELSKFFTK